MDFYTILNEVDDGQSHNPYAGRSVDGEWLDGTIDIDFLNAHFGQYDTSQEMIDATTSDGLKMFFGWLKDQGKLP